MDMERCHEFVVLAQTKNYLEASEQLFISQSSLSKHIKSLEKDLGVTLLNRSTRRVELTAEGRAFLPYAERAARIQYEINDAFSKHAADRVYSLKIGSIPVMVPYGITAILAQFEQDNADVRLKISEGDADELRDKLRKGEIELAFIREWDGDTKNDTGDEEFSALPFADDHLVAVLPEDHPLADREQLRLGELANEDFLLLPEGSVMHSLIMDACAIEGFTPHVRYRGKRAENILDLVSRGMGVSLLMRKPAMFLMDEGVRLVSVEPTVMTQIKLYYLRGAQLSDAAVKLLRYIPLFHPEE